MRLIVHPTAPAAGRARRALHRDALPGRADDRGGACAAADANPDARLVEIGVHPICGGCGRLGSAEANRAFNRRMRAVLQSRPTVGGQPRERAKHAALEFGRTCSPPTTGIVGVCDACRLPGDGGAAVRRGRRRRGAGRASKLDDVRACDALRRVGVARRDAEHAPREGEPPQPRGLRRRRLRGLPSGGDGARGDAGRSLPVPAARYARPRPRLRLHWEWKSAAAASLGASTRTCGSERMSEAHKLILSGLRRATTLSFSPARGLSEAPGGRVGGGVGVAPPTGEVRCCRSARVGRCTHGRGGARRRSCLQPRLASWRRRRPSRRRVRWW